MIFIARGVKKNTSFVWSAVFLCTIQRAGWRTAEGRGPSHRGVWRWRHYQGSKQGEDKDNVIFFYTCITRLVMQQTKHKTKHGQCVHFQVRVTPQLFSIIPQTSFFLMLHLAPFSGFWTLSLCADRRRANQRACGATRYVTGDHSQLVPSVPTIHPHSHLWTIFSTRKRFSCEKQRLSERRPDAVTVPQVRLWWAQRRRSNRPSWTTSLAEMALKGP